MLNRAQSTPRVPWWTCLATAGGVVAALVPLQQVVHEPTVLLVERFWPGAGWGWIGLLAVYAGWLVRAMDDPRRSPVWRRRLWAWFSAVFFLQLLVGLLGVERFLMTGQLHFPIPALIAAGPAYRGGGWFMPVLFLSSIVLVGPAWCSHLCYLGAWDHFAARRRRFPRALPGWSRWARWLSPLVVVGAALGLRAAGAPVVLAGAAALAFGLAGVALMGLVSARFGVMVHCTRYCPIGTLATWLGKLNPFRVVFGPACDGCGGCTRACRYDALTPVHIERRRVGPTCTLCGDCIRTCRRVQLFYRFPGLRPRTARRVFLVLAVGLHSLFLGVAMI